MIASIKVYNGEKIKRWPIWYSIFTTFAIFLIVYSFLKWWLMWWISVLFLFLVILVSYVILYLMSLKKTEIKLYDWFLMVWDKKYDFSQLLWFNIELDNKWNFTTFILVTQNSYPLRYTIISWFDEIKDFYNKLKEQWLPVNWDYEKDKLYKMIRLLKLW